MNKVLAVWLFALEGLLIEKTADLDGGQMESGPQRQESDTELADVLKKYLTGDGANDDSRKNMLKDWKLDVDNKNSRRVLEYNKIINKIRKGKWWGGSRCLLPFDKPDITFLIMSI